MKIIVEVTYKKGPSNPNDLADLTDVDRRLVKNMVEDAVGRALFYSPVLTWTVETEEAKK